MELQLIDAEEISIPDPAMVGDQAPVWRRLKPIVEKAVAVLALVTFLPLLAMIGLAIRIDSPGPVLFRQKRFGRNGVPIMVTKFRTMRHGAADNAGRVQASRGDIRVTRLGRVLRSTCLDELPQIWDVIRGDLALVGPRPHPIAMEVEGQPVEAVVRNYHARHLVRPGITGLAQICGNRGPVTSVAMGQDRIDHDIDYVRRFSFRLDIRLLFATLLVPFRRNICY